MKACFISLLLSISLLSTAQPGGGGGVRIQVFLDKNNKPIPSGDSNLIIKTFLLSGEENPVITRQYTDAERDRSYRYTGRENTRYYVPPYLWGTGGKIPAPDQCLEFIYKGDTCVVELLGISWDSGNGSAEILDTITLWPGYYNKLYCTASKRFITYWQQERKRDNNESDTVYKLLCNGITLATISPLYQFGLLEQRSPVKQVVYDKGNRYDTFPSRLLPLYTLPLKHIRYRKDSGVAISTPDIPMVENKEHLYRFLLDYLPANILALSADERNEAMKLNLQINRFQTSLRRHLVLINDKPYTGTLKIFYAFAGFSIDLNARGYSLDVIRYRNGKMINVNSYDDVDTDDELSHPRLTMVR